MQPQQPDPEPNGELDLSHGVKEFYDACRKFRGSVGEMVELPGSDHTLLGIPDTREVDWDAGIGPFDFESVTAQRSKFLVGTGGQLKNCWHQFAVECEMAALPKSDNLGDSEMERHWSIVRDIFHRFFADASNQPCQIWFHPLAFLSETILETGGYRKVSMPVLDEMREHTLREPTLLLRNRHKEVFPLIPIPVGLKWLLPDGCLEDDAVLAAIPTEHSYRGKAPGEYLGWSAERYSPIPRSATESVRVDRSLFGHEHLGYVARWDSSRMRSHVSRLQSSDSQLPASPSAIFLDVCLMKLWRLYSGRNSHVRAESLVFAFERREGKLAYLKLNDGRYQFQTGELRTWLSRR
ncbi:MAG: hypothetical protein O2931_01700 [Planctomycetota bacterium]|nr:hypothetical protein [Planctomycetota bacterium]MDA1177487.1 hypothetical protein [Planctomycetota bacterium]